MKLVLLEQRLIATVFEGSAGLDNEGFQILPFASVPKGKETPKASYVVAEFENFPIDQFNLLKGIDYLLTEPIDVINLSIGISGNIFDANHPLQIATHLVHELGIPVVVAAGNRGPGLSTLQPLAQAPWVIAVGATDAAGRLVDSSSRGAPNGSQPTVVADGTLPIFDRRFPEPATSFAAPKVSNLVAFIQKSFELLINDLSDQQEDKWSPLSNPIEMPILGIADTGVDADKLPPLPPLASSILSLGNDCVKISRTDREYRWYETLMNTFDGYSAIKIAANPQTIKRSLQRMARPLENYASHEVGSGFISLSEIENYITSFTPSHFIECLCPEISDIIPKKIVDSLDNMLGPLWDSTKCIALKEYFLGGIRGVHCKVV